MLSFLFFFFFFPSLLVRICRFLFLEVMISKGRGGFLSKRLLFFEGISVFLSSVFFPPSVCVVVVPERSVFVAVALVSFSWKWRI